MTKNKMHLEKLIELNAALRQTTFKLDGISASLNLKLYTHGEEVSGVGL